MLPKAVGSQGYRGIQGHCYCQSDYMSDNYVLNYGQRWNSHNVICILADHASGPEFLSMAFYSFYLNAI